MAIVAPLLAELHSLNATKVQAEIELIFINNEYERNRSAMAHAEKQKTLFDQALGNAMNNKGVKQCGNVVVQAENTDETKAALYAAQVVGCSEDEIDYDIEFYGYKDVVIEADKTTLQTEIEEIEESSKEVKEQITKNVQDTGMINK